MNILVSACLLGLRTRYDGGQSLSEKIRELSQCHTLIPVCPEQLGGLPTPRLPCEIMQGRVLCRDGSDKTAEFEAGAKAALDIYRLSGCQIAILKARSPSCGKGVIYDGSFTGRRVNGFGVFAKALESQGIRVITEEDTAAMEELPNGKAAR